MPDFYEDMGYSLPEEAQPIKSEGFEYYKHPGGTYRGIMGKIIVKYKDINGKKCEPTDMGARLSHYINVLWITEYLGTSGNPKNAQILLPTAEKIQLPKGVPTAELYFPFMISTDPKWQWSIHQKFENFIIPGHEESRIVIVNPNKMTEKFTNVRAFPYYYGMPIQFDIEIGEKKGSSYLANIKLAGGVESRIPLEKMAQLEKDFTELLERERTERENKPTESVPQAPAPEGDFSDIENDFLG